MHSTIVVYRQLTGVVRRVEPMIRRAVNHGAEAVLIRAALVILIGAVADRVHAVHDPGIVCPLRLLTEIPCPFCGSTSAFINIGSGDLAGAIAVQPITMLAVGVLVTKPAGWFDWWNWLSRRRKLALLLGAVAASWVYQLIRLGVIG